MRGIIQWTTKIIFDNITRKTLSCQLSIRGLKTHWKKNNNHYYEYILYNGFEPHNLVFTSSWEKNPRQ